MAIELVRTINGVEVERTDLRFVANLSISGIPIELQEHFQQLQRDRARIREVIGGALGVPADMLRYSIPNVPR